MGYFTGFNQLLHNTNHQIIDEFQQVLDYEKERRPAPGTKKRIYEQVLDRLNNGGFNSQKPSYLMRGKVQGDLVKDDLLKCLQHFGTLTKQQLIFAQNFVHSSLPFIYGPDFPNNELRIKKENFIDELFQFALICCPRRFGKSFIVSVFIACVLLTVPNSMILVFSPAQRQSDLIMEDVRRHLQFLCDTHGYTYKTAPRKDNKEILGIIVNGTERSLRSLPAKAETTRGLSATCIICEEAAAMSGKFFTEVVLPIAGPRHVSVIGISTIKGTTEEGEDNWYSTLMDMTHEDGRPFFNTYKFYLACKKCIAEGKEKSCKHMLHELPWWQDASKQMLLRQIMEKLGYEDSAAQELQGIQKSAVKTVFPTNTITQLFHDHVHFPRILSTELRKDPPIVFVSIDPAQGGDKSAHAVMSSIFHDGMFVIVGMEAIPAKMDFHREFIKKHILRLRLLPRLRNSVIVVAVENNTIGEAKRILSDVIDLKLPGVQIMKKDGVLDDLTHSDLFEGKSVGVRTQGGRGAGRFRGQGITKELMVEETLAVIQMRRLRFYHSFLTVYNENEEDKNFDPEKAIINLFEKQIKSFAIKIQQTNTEFKKQIRTYSGKHAGPDDLTTVFLLNVFWFTYYINKYNPDF